MNRSRVVVALLGTLLLSACLERGMLDTASSMQVVPSQVPADGISTATIALSLGSAAKAQHVVFASSDANAQLTQPGAAGSEGIYKGTIRCAVPGLQTIEAYLVDGNETVKLPVSAQVLFTASGDGTAPSATHSVLTASPGTFVANGADSIQFTLVLRSGSGAPLAGSTVTWDATGTQNQLGAMSGVTDANGVATTALQSTRAEAKTVHATVQGVVLSAGANFVAGAAHDIISSATGPAVADGSSALGVTASVIDVFGNAVPGASVSFAAADPNTSVVPANGTAGADGLLNVTVVSTSVGTQNVVMTSGSASHTQVVVFVAGAPTAATSSLTLNPTSLVADGATASTLTTILNDAWGHAVPNITVTLTSTGTGNSVAPVSGPTDALGQFVASMVSTHAEVKSITAAAAGLNLSAQATFVAGPADGVRSTLTASPASLTADGITTTTLSVTVLDAAGNPLVGQSVTLSSTGSNNTFGALTGTTDATGHWTTSMSSTRAEVKVVTATLGGTNVSTNVTFVAGAASASTTTLVAAPSTVTADGTSTSVLKTTVLDAHGNPVSGQVVTYGATGSALVWTPATPTATTNASGVASVRLASTVAESKTITATVGGFSKITTVLFAPGTPSSTVSTLNANPNTLLADGTSVTSIVVTVADAKNNPVNGQAVTFSCSGAGYTFSSTTGSTGSNGQLTTTLVSTVAEAKTITARFAGATLTTIVTFKAGAASSLTSSLTATPSSLTADGVTFSALAVTVKDAQGNAAAGQAVTFTASGTGYTITPSSGTTLASGVFNANIVSTIAEVKTVTATAGSVIAAANVTFTSGGASSTSTTFVANPSTVSADGVSVSTVTAHVVDGQNNPVVGLNVAFSTSGAGTWNPTSSGVTDGNGLFSATLASSSVGSQTVTANIDSGAITKTATVNFTTPLVSTVNSTFSASPTSLIANGIATTALTVTVRDGSNTPLTGQTVTLSSNGSANTFSPASGTTDGSGVFTSTLKSTVAQAKTLSALVDGTTLTAAVTFIAGAPSSSKSTLTANPNTRTADGATNSNILVTVLDAQGNPVQGQAVTFAYGGASYTLTPTSGVTGAAGTLAATLNATLAQQQNATAAIGSAFTFATPVTFTAGAASSANSTFGAAPTNVTADGVSTSLLTFTAIDAHGNPISGQLVSLGSTGTNYVFTPPSGNTNASGVFNANMTSTKAEVKSVTGTAGGASRAANVTFVAGPPSNVTSQLIANPNALTADGASTTVLTFTLQDAQGNPISGKAVHMSSTGSANVFANPNGTTDSSGNYSTTLASTKAETKTISANAFGLTETADVVFNVGNPNGAVSTLTASPVTLTANGVAASTVTLTLTDVFGNPVSAAPITFSATGLSNTLNPNTCTTDALGSCTTTIKSTKAAVKVVSASTTGVTENASVTFVAGSPNATNSSLSASPTRLLANGSATTTLLATVIDACGNSINGAGVTFSSNGSTNTFTPSNTCTTSSGTCSVLLKSTTAEAKTVTASMGIGVTAAVTFTATSLVVSGIPTPTNIGFFSDMVVTARDGAGNTVSSYTGIVHITSSDTGAVLPGDYTFVPGNAGRYTFSSAVEFETVGTQSVTATDTLAAITGVQSSIVVRGRAPSALSPSADVHSQCVTLSDHNIKCWGYNVMGTLGIGDTNNRGSGANQMGTNLPVLAFSGIPSEVAVGRHHACALYASGQIACWGDNSQGQLGLGDTLQRNVPTAVPLPTGRTVVSVSASAGDHTCVLYDNSAMSCWGNGSTGASGLGNTVTKGNTTATTPNKLAAINFGARTPVQMFTGGGADTLTNPISYPTTCAILDNAQLACWGSNGSGELGFGDTTNRGGTASTLPATDIVSLGTGRTAQDVALGYGITCALLDDGTMKCWGDNSGGALGLGDTIARGATAATIPSKNPNIFFGTGRTVQSIAAGSSHVCAILDTNALICFGSNASAQLGLGDTTDRGGTAATAPPNLSAVNLGSRVPLQVNALDISTCMLSADHNVVCWGDNANGELGQGDTLTRGDATATRPSTIPNISF